MKTIIKNLSVLVLAGFVFTGCATGHCCKPQQWEYKAIALAATGQRADESLNKLANEGWQLITVIPDQNGSAANYYFKRPKQ